MSALANIPLAAAKGSFLIKPSVGLMLWTLIVFAATMALLARLAFPRISQALERRQRMIEESIDTAQRTREEAERILAEYRQRLTEARAQADEIVQRARQAAQAHEREAKEQGHEIVAEAARKAQREIEAATRRALDDIRREVADLTIIATEKVTRKALDEADQRRLVEEALAELDFSAISAGALFLVAREHGKLDLVREQLGQFADALQEYRELAVFFFSPYFSTHEKQEALGRLLVDADVHVVNFLRLLIEKHRMPVLFRARQEYEKLWQEENRMLAVEITSAIELDPATTESVGRRIGERAGRKVMLAAKVDPDILGGIVVRIGNSVLDASIRNRLEQLRRAVAQGAA